jgi:hypothetical protein
VKTKKKRRRRRRDWFLYTEKEEALQRPPPSFPATTFSTANDSEYAPSLQIIFSPSLICLPGWFHLHAEHEQFTFCNK